MLQNISRFTFLIQVVKPGSKIRLCKLACCGERKHLRDQFDRAVKLRYILCYARFSLVPLGPVRSNTSGMAGMVGSGPANRCWGIVFTIENTNRVTSPFRVRKG